MVKTALLCMAHAGLMQRGNGRRWSAFQFRVSDAGFPSRSDGPAPRSVKQQVASDNERPVLGREIEFGLGSTHRLRSVRSCLVGDVFCCS